MAQIASLAAVIGAGASLYGQVQAQQDREKRQREQNRAQRAFQEARQAERQAQVEQRNAETTAEAAARAEQLRIGEAAARTAREAALARTIARVRARLAAGGVSPEGGSAQALVAGLRAEAATSDEEASALLEARLAANRPSLLAPASTVFTPGLQVAGANYLTLGNSIGALTRNLLG